MKGGRGGKDRPGPKEGDRKKTQACDAWRLPSKLTCMQQQTCRESERGHLSARAGPRGGIGGGGQPATTTAAKFRVLSRKSLCTRQEPEKQKKN